MQRGIYFRAVGFEAIIHKTAAVVTRGNKKMVAGAPVAPVTLTTKRVIGERAGDERSWKYTFLKKYIIFRKSIYFRKIYTSEIWQILDVRFHEKVK